METKLIATPDGHQIEVLIWPNPSAKAWVHLLHGMSEHATRYDEFARYLVNSGYAVIAHNHRGHGSSPTTTLGTYADKDGWNKVLTDIDQVRDSLTDKKPYYMFAHSMGTFITQAYLSKQPTNPINGLILSGSNIQPGPLLKTARMIAQIEKLRIGPNKVSPVLQFLSFGSFNTAFKPNRTEFDWLSRNPEAVDNYINDPLCGFDCKVQLWLDLFSGLIDLYANKGYENIQANLPILCFGGDKDPVGEMGKGLTRLSKAYKHAGQKDVTLKLYKDGRHEMLNETNREQVYHDVINWLESK